MSSFRGFLERVQSQVGMSQMVEEDYSFLQPGGNDHLMQFFFASFPDVYDDLDIWDRNNFLLMDISSELGLDFILDEDGGFAVYISAANQKSKTVQVVLDLRDEYIVSAYYYGDLRFCTRLNQTLGQCSHFHRCFMDSDRLKVLVGHFEKPILLRYTFEQFKTMFISPLIVKGEINGETCGDMILGMVAEKNGLYNVESIGGFLSEGARGEISADSRGRVLAESSRLSDFMRFAADAFMVLQDKYHGLVNDSLIQLTPVSNSTLIRAHGEMVGYSFTHPVEKIEGLLTFFTKGGRESQLIGISERLSRKLWRVTVTDSQTGGQLEFEVSNSFFRAFVTDRSGIAILDMVEAFSRFHLSAAVARLDY